MTMVLQALNYFFTGLFFVVITVTCFSLPLVAALFTFLRSGQPGESVAAPVIAGLFALACCLGPLLMNPFQDELGPVFGFLFMTPLLAIALLSAIGLWRSFRQIVHRLAIARRLSLR